MLILFTITTEQAHDKFEYLFHQYKKLLLYKAYNILHDHAMAEDATSEAFIRIYKNLHKIDQVDSNQTISFLVTIVTNTAITIVNKEKRNNTIPVDFEQTYENHDTGYNLEEEIISETISENMLDCINSLKEELKAPFLLKYAHDYSHKEIASFLNITENNVTVRIHRAKQRLAQILHQEGYVNEI
ncbi:MAG: RNA polymerase sigma factor [Lachnospiraceae bacterium]|nr:RNA polymerase sigma factor [Lachnospiraceae bacterium]